MVRTEISLFLKNVPGELGKLAKTLPQAGINIAARAISHMGARPEGIFIFKFPSTDGGNRYQQRGGSQGRQEPPFELSAHDGRLSPAHS
jgi:hypothetical protein